MTAISDEFVQQFHKYNCDRNGWRFQTLIPGTYAYDCIAVSTQYMMDQCNNDKTNDITAMAQFLHEGWAKNYIYWRDEKPWQKDPTRFHKPSKPIKNKEREQLAQTPYSGLSAKDKDGNLFMAQYIVANLNVV